MNNDGPDLGELADELAAIDDPHARGRARSFAAALLELHGEAVARILDIVATRAEDATVSALLDDPLVASLLVLHDLHPVPLQDRVQQAVDEARSQLGPLASGLGEVTVVDDVVEVVLRGPADNEQASVGVQSLLSRLLRTRAPDIDRLVLVSGTQRARGGRTSLPLVGHAPS